MQALADKIIGYLLAVASKKYKNLEGAFWPLFAKLCME